MLGKSAITDKYIDIELRERHKSAKRKQMSAVCNDIINAPNNSWLRAAHSNSRPLMSE